MKRTVVFFKSLEAPSVIHAWVLSERDSVELWRKRRPDTDIYLHHEEIDIPEYDTTEEELEALEAKLDKEREEFEGRSYGLAARINELREKRHEQAS